MTANIKPNRYLRFVRRLRWFFTVYLLPRHTAWIETENGLLAFDSRDRNLGRTLHVHRHFEIDGIDFIGQWMRRNNMLPNEPKGCMLDVGGYVGMICIAMMRRNIFQQAIALEPFPESYRLLQLNIGRNCLESRISTHNVALSDRNSSMSFELSPKNYGDHRIRVSNENGAHNEMRRSTTTVAATRFDDLVSAGRLGVATSEIKLVWADIQGHEGRFLDGAKQFLQAHPGVPVFIEFWPYGIQRAGTSRERFCEIVSESFTHYYTFDDGVETKCPIASMAAYFSKYDAPDAGSHIVLIREN
ncbi:MAG: hypothetical protein A2W18_00845 [Candidatus Muproteobacteria bacterium RBG_16_60_9]|uniref:Methyltransferase FkbM domain-containing protein n=1 Tax=Candidatus Muproteobacteria bacterium RBG_16_60_9 TaxID=1817755 RepID=A0A1F6V847_9PROT|nr:MAG: hypothetical protein A2W18_00845 [Candidatus Muproteobacteria bacterium RBG_16_60_9]